MNRLYRVVFTVILSVFWLIHPTAAQCSHSWGTSEYVWNSTHTKCEMIRVCHECEETFRYETYSITAKTASDPGCDSPGNTEYTASFDIDGTVYTNTTVIYETALGHNCGSPAFQWSEDGTVASASAYCSRCEQYISLDCKVSADITSATCASDGIAVYTASVTLSGKSYQEQNSVILPQLEHRYSVPQFEWTDAECYAHYTCMTGNETEATACTVTEQKTWDNCTDPGVLTRTATITLNGIPYTDEKKTELPAKRHSSDRIVGFAATCTEDGLTDGQYCRDCGEILQEQSVIPAAGHKEIHIPGVAPTCTEGGYTDRIVCGICQTELQAHTPVPASHTIAIQPAIAPTCTQPGMSEGQRCTACGEELLVPSPQPAHGHLYGDAVFTWHNASSVSAKRTCSHGCGSVLSGSVSLTSSTTMSNGVTTTTVRASADFPDGTTAQQTKFFRSEIPTQPTTPIFSDVIRGSYYENAVAWALEEGITQGTGNGKFSPEMDCSRAQIVTMLWRAAGSPKNACATVFEDVAESVYYYHAVAWAFEKGITAGTAATTFSPDMPCTRAQIVTMLWRAADCPESDDPLPFTDVDADIWYADAVAWAVENGITQGTGSGQFSPDAVCTRAQIVTFLYRAEMKN